jgi:hypothetical protein
MEMCKAWKRFQVYSLNFTKNISPYLIQIFIKEHCPVLNSITDEKQIAFPSTFKIIMI